MHLAHPALSMSGKRKGKQKFRNADEARKARELAQEWEQKQAEWKAMSKPVPKSFTIQHQSLTPRVPPGRESPKIPSLDTWVTGAVTTKKPEQYTGNNLLGITIVHKSCLQPVFNKEQAEDAAKMRR